MEPAERLLTVRDVAERLNVRPGWVYARVEAADCDLPYIRLGRYVRFEPQAIEGYIAAARCGGGNGDR